MRTGSLPALSTLLWSVALITTLTGCPPAGDPPAFVGPDAQAGAGGEAGGQGGAVDDRCVDVDGDGRVAVGGCPLPPGDCDPEDSRRAVGLDEICDGLDNDCDERVDEGDPMLAQGCEVPDALGPCAEGQWSCEAGDLSCVAVASPGPEACDGVDNDCDGAADEDLGGEDCAAEAEGVCGAGVRRCEGGAWRCEAGAPAEEICDGADNDCDGAVDEADPDLGAACATPLPGRCAEGRRICDSGRLRCEGLYTLRAERCDGLDDDCDGEVDELWPVGAPCVVGVGACAAEGAQVCTEDGAGAACDAVAGEPTPEICDGVDNDCDGATDEASDVPCYEGPEGTEGVGLCGAGRRRCAGGVLGACVEQSTPAAERCDDADNDCDGVSDEGFDLGTPCTLGLGICARLGALACGPDGAARCLGEVGTPQLERCNGLDDDCDGATDEAFADLGAPCAVGEGTCRAVGVIVCGGQGTACGATPGAPEVEICDGLDNDCDGRVDNQAECPSAPSAQITQWALVSPEALAGSGCADLTGDGAPDGALGAYAAVMNPVVAEALSTGRYGAVISGDLASLSVAGVEAAGWPDLRSFEPTGRPLARWTGLDEAAGVTRGVAAAAVIPSPLMFEPQSLRALDALAAMPLSQAQIAATVEADEAGLVVQGGWLTGAVEHEAWAAALAEAKVACALAESPPPSCAGIAGLDAVAPDVDLDEDGAPESVSVCVAFAGAPAPEVRLPPEGGQGCEQDDDCLAGLSCRPVGAGITACGVAGRGGAPDGAGCEVDADCLHGVCVAGGPWGGRCAVACGADADCPQGLACRGVEGTPIGPAQVCVVAPGSGQACAADEGCALGQVCTPWYGEDGWVGRCQQRAALGGELGDLCAGPTTCRRGGESCVGAPGARTCAAPCQETAQCPEGLWCALTEPGGDTGEGACQVPPPGSGSARPCGGEADCPGGETCTPRSVGERMDPICLTGVGFGSVSQRCEVDEDCASGACVEGRCGGYCQDGEDCGSRLGCLPDAYVEGGQVLGGRCGYPSEGCLRDADCSADPLCQGSLCVCDVGQCRLGCRYPGGRCPQDQICQPDGGCELPCEDDRFEPDDEQGEGAVMRLTRAAPAQVQRHRLCAGAPVDRAQVHTGGQPFELHVVAPAGLDGASTAAQITLRDPEGALIDGGLLEGARFTISVLDPVEAAQWVEGPLELEVHGAALGAGLMWRLEAEIFPAPCPEDEPGEPADESWHWQQVLLEPGLQVESSVSGHLCPGDADWYAVYLANGDSLTVDPRGPAGEAPVALELWGPDFPEAGGILVASLPAGEDGALRFTPPQKVCNELLMHCEYPNLAQTEELCFADSDCPGTGWFIRAAGAGPLISTPYTLDLGVVRGEAVSCVPDVYENDRTILPTIRPLAAVDPSLLDASGPLLSVRPEEDITFEGFRACGEDWDLVSFGLLAGEGLRATVRQPAAPARLLDVEIVYGPTGDPLVSVQSDEAEITLEVQAVEEATAYPIAARAAEGVPQETPFPLSFTVRRLRPGFVPDTHCEAPIQLTPALGVPQVASVEGATLDAVHDEAPYACIGGEGPDRVYAFPAPGAGRVQAVVTPEGGWRPVVSLRTECEVEGSALACGAGGPGLAAEAAAEVEGAGPIYISVDGDVGGAYTLEVQWTP